MGVNDVVQIGESLHHLVAEFGEHRKGANETQGKLQSSLYMLGQTVNKDQGAMRPLRNTTEVLQPRPNAMQPVPAQMAPPPGAIQNQVRLEPVARPMGHVVVPGTGQPGLYR